MCRGINKWSRSRPAWDVSPPYACTYMGGCGVVMLQPMAKMRLAPSLCRLYLALILSILFFFGSRIQCPIGGRGVNIVSLSLAVAATS